MDHLFDHIVVGSGCTGAMAAQTLAESGSRVAMLDVGRRDGIYKTLIPDRDFNAIRRTDPDQHRYFLGDNFEGIPWNDVRVGAQLTPPRQFIHRDVDRWLPFASETFKPMESLAYGGLGSGWGQGCYVFSPKEIRALGLPETALDEGYRTVLRRIGISGGSDDGAPYCTRGMEGYDPPIELDESMKAFIQAYRRKRDSLNGQGFFLGQPAESVITRDRDGRKAYGYKDMDFWEDGDRSAYRPWITIDALKGREGFSYFEGRLALRFRERDDRVEVVARRVDEGTEESFWCRRLVLASGVLGTARIVVRSFDYRRPRLPIICNPYSYIPMIHWRMLGKPIQERKTGFGQLVMFRDKNRDNFGVASAHMYTYRSLLLYKLIKESPLNFAGALPVMRALQSSFLIVGFNYPDQPGPEKYIELEPAADSAAGDRLRATYIPSAEEERTMRDHEQAFRRAYRSLGCMPIKRIDPGHGSSIHYAGTLPFSETDRPDTLAADGRLHGTRAVYVADGSGFDYLPAKGLTFSLMANAHRVAACAAGR